MSLTAKLSTLRPRRRRQVPESVTCHREYPEPVHPVAPRDTYAWARQLDRDHAVSLGHSGAWGR